MTPDAHRREIERLKQFHAELIEAERKDPHMYVEGWGRPKHARNEVERQIIELERERNGARRSDPAR